MRNELRTEKMRHEVAVQRFAFPLRDAAPSALEEFWGNRHTYNRATNAHWTDGGPCNFAGRATCLVVDPSNPDVLYAGSAAGGLWKWSREADEWISCWPNSVNQNIGAVALDPDDPSRVICATGEGNLSTASYPGSGIYLSENAGLTWRPYVFVPGQRRMTPEQRDRMPRRVSCIAFSARKNGRRHLAFGSISNDENLPGGLYLCGNQSGGSLNFVDRWSTRPYNCYSVVFHPVEQSVLYAGIEAGGAVNGIWRSRNGGADWEQLTNGLPSGEAFGRISLAISSKDPDVLFALASSRSRRVLGVFRSGDGGRSWRNRAGTDFEHEGQLAFNNAIAIHPDDPDIVVCGARGLHLTTDGGRMWLPISERDRALSARERNPSYVHSDHHAIVMPGGDVIYTANDGGIAKSTDLGETWQDASHGMNTVMFYAIDVSPVNKDLFGGGAQDNGTLLAGINSGTGGRPLDVDYRSFVQVLEGDGGYVVFDPKEEELVYASTFETETRRHTPGRPWTRGLLGNQWTDVSPDVPGPEKDVRGLTVMAIKPAYKDQPAELLLGTNRLWRTADRGRTWRKSDVAQFDGSAITAIEVAGANPRTVFVGTAKGGIYRSTDGGHQWSEDLAGPEIPNRVITQIETHPRKPSTVVVTAASTGRLVTLNGESKPYSHVFLSLDSGRTWSDIDGGRLPNVVINGLAYETQPPYRLFVAGDAGPWVLESDGRWVSIAGDMPSAVISDIIYHHKSKTLTAGTYGRGIWRLKVPERFDIASGETLPNASDLFPPAEGYLLDRQAPVPDPLSPELSSVQPRRIRFSCTPVANAEAYVFEAFYEGMRRYLTTASRSPETLFDLRTDGSFRWRCWALLPHSRSSFPSRALSFTVRSGAS